MKTKRFQKRPEDFICENCGAEIKGDGYTNHCPQCLWSKHVDINPGDRQASCKGLMEPTNIEVKKGGYVITHRCQTCGHQKNNKVQANDDMDTVINISAGQKDEHSGRQS